MESKELNKFNLRVYAIIENQKNEILVSDEVFNKVKMTKFPGGGMHPGEGTIDCLKREAIEEFGQAIEVSNHFYTTDYFVRTRFFNDRQLISIYYKAKFIDPVRFKISKVPYDFTGDKDGTQSFRWVAKNDISKENFTFEIDKKVADMLYNE